MTQTSTPLHDAALKCPEKSARPAGFDSEPSVLVIQNILSFSRNLEVKPSGLIGDLQFMKS